MWFINLRFALLAVLLFILMCFFTLNGQWIADFWVHSAAVRELITNISDPSHHQLLLDVPFPGYSPYTVAVAFFGKLFNVEAISILSVAGILKSGAVHPRTKNVCIRSHSKSQILSCILYTAANPLLVGIQSLVHQRFFPYRCAWVCDALPLHIRHGVVSHYTQPEPTPHSEQPALALPAEFLLTIIVLISHLPTFVFLAAGLISFALTAKKQLLFEVLIAVSILAGSLLLSAIWPYFSMLNFLLVKSAAHHIRHQHSSLYQEILSRTWPALAAIPLVIVKSDPIPVTH